MTRKEDTTAQAPSGTLLLDLESLTLNNSYLLPEPKQ